jgi:D-alanyl-D-alanine-carboxypeptidase/D-alanyl-D-alanine-endopeptidase
MAKKVMKPSNLRCVAILIWLSTVGLTSLPLPAQAAPKLSGDFSGTLGSLHLELHITVAADGTLTGALDSPDQGVKGIPCSDFRLAGDKLSFKVPSVRGSWSGSVQNSGAMLVGTWTQGSPTPLTFTRGEFVPATVPSAVDGFWLGTLKIDNQSLRLQITVKSDAAGHELCTLDSLDQNESGIACADVNYSGRSFSFAIPPAAARWTGTLSQDGKNLLGSWTQRETVPFNFMRQEKPISPSPQLPETFLPAMNPLDAEGMQAVLNRDFEQALKDGVMAPQTAFGMTSGVLRKGIRRVFSYGTAHPDSVFEIGSVTKTFTGLVLAQMSEQGKIRLDQPVRELLPAGTVSKPEGQEVTLLDLVTQHSGLPRLPDNFKPADPSNPYVDYHSSNLYEYLARHGVQKPADATFLYSNLGFGLLGQALANRAGRPYEQLLKQQIINPLGLEDTGISLTPNQQSRFIEGHTATYEKARPWEEDSLAGGGAIRSTADDMLTYLEANLHPEKLSRGTADASARTLPNAIKLSHELRNEALSGTHIAFAWIQVDSTGIYWHNGATGGYSSYVFFNPQEDYAAVVLLNRAPSPKVALGDLIGQHIAQRFAGKPAVSLDSAH